MTIIVHEWDSDARCKRCLIPKALAPKPQLCPGKPPAARAAARMRWPLDGADAQALEAALSLTERERDEAKGRTRRACQLLVEEVGANGPADVDKVSERAAVLIRELRDQVNGLRASAEESEHQMHLRIRAGYDKTIADSWRAKVAEVEQERDEARAEVERLRERNNLVFLTLCVPRKRDEPIPSLNLDAPKGHR